MHRPRWFALFVSIPCLLAAPGIGLAESHEGAKPGVSAAPQPIPWNPDEVVKDARELQRVAESLRTLERNAPQDTIASGQAKARERYSGLLRQMREGSRKLADAVEGGASREDTANDFNRLLLAGRNAAEEARRMFLSQATINEILKAEKQMNQLQLYYTGETPARRALSGPSKDDGGGK